MSEDSTEYGRNEGEEGAVRTAEGRAFGQSTQPVQRPCGRCVADERKERHGGQGGLGGVSEGQRGRRQSPTITGHEGASHRLVCSIAECHQDLSVAGSHRTVLRRITWTPLSFKGIPLAAVRTGGQEWEQGQMGGGDYNRPDER